MVEPILSLAPREWTLEDLQDIDDELHRFEIVEGALLVMSPPTVRHEVLAARLVEALNAVAPPGLRAFPALAVELGRTVRLPDVVLVRGDPLALGRLAVPPSAVALAVEVQSPSTAQTDRLLKAHEYAAAGIDHYWRLDPGDGGPTLTATTLHDGVYRLVGEWAGEQEAVLEHPLALRLRPSDLLRSA